MLVKNSFLYGLTSIFKGVSVFLIIAVYTRMLVPSAYGDLSIILIIMSFADVFGFQWIRQSVLRHITDKQKPTDAGYLSNAMILYAAVTVVCFALCWTAVALGLVGGDGKKLMYQFLGFLILGESLSNLMLVMARVRLNNRLFMIMSTSSPIVTLAVGALLMKAGLGVIGAICGSLASSAVCAILGFTAIADFRKIRLRLFNKETMRNIAFYGLPLAIVLSVQTGIWATDRILIQNLIGSDATGLYAAAQQIPSRIFNLLLFSIHLSAYPLAVSKLDHEGEDACRAQLRSNYTLLLGIGLPAAIGMMAVAPALANILTGPNYRDFVAHYLGYFAITAFLNNFIQYYFALSFNFSKKTGRLVLPFAGSLLVNLVIGYFGIIHFGVIGAVIGSLAAYVFLLFSVIHASRGVFRMPVPLKPTLQIVGSCLMMAAIVLMLGAGHDTLGLLLAVMAGGVVYAVCIFGFNTGNVRMESQKYLSKFLKKAA